MSRPVFASVKIYEIVDLIPLYCEMKRFGPGVIDEGRGEGMISEIKNHSARTDEPLEWIPDTYEAIVEKRRQDPNRRKTQALAHILSTAATEILAPCIFEEFLHVKENWSDFCERWQLLHSAYWSTSGKAFRFVVGNDVGARTILHCSCNAHSNLVDLPVSAWQ